MIFFFNMSRSLYFSWYMKFKVLNDFCEENQGFTIIHPCFYLVFFPFIIGVSSHMYNVILSWIWCGSFMFFFFIFNKIFM